METITEAATLRGWRWYHVRRSDKALTMGSPGFPDLVLTRRGVTIFMELKAEGGEFRPGQEAWIGAINGGRIPHPGSVVQAHVVRPSDLDEALSWLV